MQTKSARWFGAGQSSAIDSAKAGAEATAAALSGRTPAIVFVFASIAHDLPPLLEAVRAEAGAGPVIVGSTSMAEISPGGPSEHSVAIAALGGDGFVVRTRVATIGADGHRAAGAEVAAAMADVQSGHRALLLLFDGFCGHPHEVVRGAYSVVGARVPLVGGLAGADVQGTSPHTAQFYGVGGAVEVLTNAVVGIALGSDRPLGVGIAHGWRRTEPAMIVTRSVDGTIFEIDGRPALDVLTERLGTAATVEAAFRDGMVPIGLSRRSGEDVRLLNSGDAADRSVSSAAVIPQGALFWIMEADHDDLIAGARQSCVEALAGLGGEPALGVLAFDCCGRLVRLGEQGTRDEVAAIREVLGDTPFAGFYTMGEVTPPTQWVTRGLFTLRAGAVVGLAVGGARGGDAVADGDLLGADDDVFDEES